MTREQPDQLAHIAELENNYSEKVGKLNWESNGANYDISLHQNPDAKAWATAFIETFPNCGANHGNMLGWFTNAMMAMHDYVKQDRCKRIAELEQQLADLQNKKAVLLSNDQIGECYNAPSWYEFARAIERAVIENNGIKVGE